MITLLTGTPGSGKTLYLLRFMCDLEKSYRFIYVHGVSGLKLDHEIIVCESKTCDFCQSLPDYESYKKVKNWNTFADNGAVFFLDECQHVYRNKGSMSVSEFETHRHKGFDFYLITQHPMLINTDLRRLVGRHIHLVADFLGRHQYEWVECSQGLTKTNAIKSKYSLDKSLFALYHSASLHTKQERKFPIVVYVFFASIILFSVLFFKLKNRFSPDAVVSSQSHKVTASSSASSSAASSSSASVDYAVLLKSARLDGIDCYPTYGCRFQFVSGSQTFDSVDLGQHGYTVIKKSNYDVLITNRSLSYGAYISR